MNSTQKQYSDKFTLGDLELKNRVVMASLTRLRCDPKSGIPTELHANYYAQRANAGLILTECSPIMNNAQAFLGAGGIYNKDHTAGWKKVTDAVHNKDSKIFMQIWHGGRATNPEVVGEKTFGPSAIPIRSFNKDGEIVDGPIPQEMTIEDIEKVKKQFKESAILAKEAGFDGLELHGANGYLIDEFIRDHSNKRTDKYGGSIENRCRFCLEVIDVLAEVFGPKRIGIKLSPVGRFQDMFDSSPIDTYTYLVKELDKKGIAFIQFMEPTETFYSSSKKLHVDGKEQIENVAKTFRPYFKGALIANNGFTPESGIEKIRSGDADLLSFGRFYISNPDLANRLINKWPLNEQLDRSTFYQGGEKGYIDYETYKSASL